MNKKLYLPSGISKFILGSAVVFSSAGIVWAAQESTVFTFDGKDFIRKETTLVMEDGKSAVGTKLDQDSPAYKALMQKHSYTGDVTVFGHSCNGSYAPLTDDGGNLTGAIFVCNK